MENWLSLSNEMVQAILIEAARPRTRELYSRELVLFLGKSIPQEYSSVTSNEYRQFQVFLSSAYEDVK